MNDAEYEIGSCEWDRHHLHVFASDPFRVVDRVVLLDRSEVREINGLSISQSCLVARESLFDMQAADTIKNDWLMVLVGLSGI